ncbi:hypothetical protein GCM10009789_60890 [Kribbella sancticallisti]|uniref:Uncharacterized protein n=1 Tax=Kribbella sancticallisti TaxID=460087 RepID=A0ABN2E7B6_9ACTN
MVCNQALPIAPAPTWINRSFVNSDIVVLVSVLIRRPTARLSIGTETLWQPREQFLTFFA